MDRHKPAMSRSQAFEESENVGRNASQPDHGRHHRHPLPSPDLLKNSLAVAAITATVSPRPGCGPAREAAAPEASFSFTEIEAGVDETHHVALKLPRRHSDPLGRPGPAGCPGVRPERTDRRGPEAAVRLQQRLRGLLPARGQLRAWPPCGQPRVHQRGDHVSRPLGPQDTRRRASANDAGHGGRRDGRAWRLGARDPQGRRPLAGGAGRQVQPPHHRSTPRWSSPARWPAMRSCRPRPTPPASWSACSTTAPAASRPGAPGSPPRRTSTAISGARSPRTSPLAASLKRYGVPGNWYTGPVYDRLDVTKEPNESHRFGWMVEIDPTDPHLDAQEAHGPGPIQARGRGRDRQQDGKRWPTWATTSGSTTCTTSSAAPTTRRPRRQHGPARRGHALRRRFDDDGSASGCRWSTAKAR